MEDIWNRKMSWIAAKQEMFKQQRRKKKKNKKIKLESEEEEKLAHDINPQEIKILRGKKE